MPILVLCTDNIMEYMKSDVLLFCANIELFTIQFVHISQQNGVAERKYARSRCCSYFDDSHAYFKYL